MCRRTCSNARHALPCRAAIRSQRRSRAKQLSRFPSTAPPRSPAGRSCTRPWNGGKARQRGVLQIDPIKVAVAPDEGTSLIAFRHGDRHAVFAVSQSLRPDATAVVRRFKALGLELAILSGDRADAVAPIAATLGIAHWRAGLKPSEKIAFIERMKGQGRRVLMVGDGINDAPALAAAHAFADQRRPHHPGTGRRRLHGRAASAGARRHDHRVPRPPADAAELWLAALYNAIAIPIAAIGLVTPFIAAAAMSGSSILVTLNALRATSHKEAPTT